MGVKLPGPGGTPHVDTLRVGDQEPEVQVVKQFFEPFHGQVEVAGNKNRAARTGISYGPKPNACRAWKKPEQKSPYGF